jgi:hypothetical protein
VHCLRKTGPAHRGIRPGILTAALLAGALAALASCSARGAGAPAAPAADAAAPGAAWYQLQSGVFQPVAAPAAGAATARRPWTVQSRVADMAFLGGELFCAVNGAGLAVVGRDAAGAPSFRYHPDSLIFAHRTISTLVPRQGGLTVHLYYNALLNDAARDELTLNGVSLVTWMPTASDYAFLMPPFQKKNPDWEAVGFATESENSFDIEWKYTDAVETRFAYTRFHADTKTEEPADRDTYLAALGVPAISGSSVPTTLASFFSACRASLAPSPAALLFSLRARESPIRRNYRSERESDSAVAIPVFEEQGSLYALLPPGRVLCSVADAQRTLVLPRLPDGFRYTDIVRWGDSLLIPWEETAFTDVGRAGILVYPVPRP